MPESFYFSESLVSNVEGFNETIFDTILSKTDKIIHLLEEIQDLEELIEDEEVFKNQAVRQAIEDVSEIVPNYILTEVSKAAVQSIEYNYEPYINHLLQAILLNIDNLIFFDIEDQYIRIETNFEILGDITEWANCVTRTRELLNLGKTRGKTHEESGEDLALKIWREKIYGTAREGLTVTKTYKGRGKEKKGAGTVDITERYSSKYLATIEARLSFLPSDKAPYWYLINNGNSNLYFPNSISEEGYPVNPPTRFVNNITRYLRSLVNELKDNYFRELRDAFEENYRNYFKVDRDKVEEKVGDWLDEETNISEIPEGTGWLGDDYEELAKNVKVWKNVIKGEKVGVVRYKGQFTKGGFIKR